MSSEIKLRVNTRDYERKMAKAEKTTKKMNNTLKKGSKSSQGAFSRLVGKARGLTSALGGPALGAAAVATALGAVVLSSINAAAALETTTVKFEVLTGSAKKANQHVRELVDFTAKTPFQFEGVSGASAVLQSFGFSADDTIVKLRSIGDVASVTGSTIKELATIYGQVTAAGKLTGERLLQLQERGVPILDALAKHYGKTTSEVQKMITAGQVSATTFRQVFDTLSDKGGFAFKGMEKQSKTLNGKISTLKDNFTILGQEIGKIFVPAAKKGTDALTSMVQTFTRGTKEIWGGGLIKSLTGRVSDFFKSEEEIAQRSAYKKQVILDASARERKEKEEQDAIDRENARKAELEKELIDIQDYNLLKHEKLSELAQLRAEADRADKEAEVLREMGKNKEMQELQVKAYQAREKIKDLQDKESAEKKKKQKQKERKEDAEAFGALMAMQNSQYAALAAVGKTAALARLWIDTKSGAASTYASVFRFLSPFMGPGAAVPAAAAAGGVIAYGAEQAAGIVGLNQGGTVMGRAGASPYEDSIPARLTVKETVISQKVTNKIEKMADNPPPQQLVFNSSVNVQGNVIADNEEQVAMLAEKLTEVVENYGVRMASNAVEK